MEDYIAYNINRRVQDNVKAFGVEGFFIFALMGILLFSFILLVILNTFLNVIIATIISIGLFVFSGIIATYLSRQWGIRGMIRKLGSFRQPQDIFCNCMTFKINKHEDRILGR